MLEPAVRLSLVLEPAVRVSGQLRQDGVGVRGALVSCGVSG